MISKTASLQAQKNYLLADFEEKYVDLLRPFFLKFKTDHLTLMTILWSALAVSFGMMICITGSPLWLLGISATILLQYITDHFDGYVGRYNKTGLVKWGYFMDHLLDHIFLCSLFLGYLYILPDGYAFWAHISLLVFSALMMHVFIRYLMTGKLNISYYGVGPTEARIIALLLNGLVLIFGAMLLVYFLICFCTVACAVLLRELWNTRSAITRMRIMKGMRFPYIMPALFLLAAILVVVTCLTVQYSHTRDAILYLEVSILTTVVIHTLLASEPRGLDERIIALTKNDIMQKKVPLFTLMGCMLAISWELLVADAQNGIRGNLIAPSTLLMPICAVLIVNIFMIQRKLRWADIQILRTGKIAD